MKEIVSMVGIVKKSSWLSSKKNTNDSFDVALSENCDLGQTGGTALKGDQSKDAKQAAASVVEKDDSQNSKSEGSDEDIFDGNGTSISRGKRSSKTKE